MEVKTTIVAAIAAVVSAAMTAGASIYIAKNSFKDATDKLVRYVYENGNSSSTSIAGGKMVIVVNGSNNTSPVSRPVDMDRLISLCGDVDGCTITMGATRFRTQAVTEYIQEAPLQGAPCRFFYTKSKHWSLSQACVAIYGLFKWSAVNKKYEFDRAYQIYEYGNSFGTDDSGSASNADPDGQPLNILSFKGACYLAESAADTQKGGGRLLPDDPKDVSNGRGLHFIASSPSWDYPGSYPKDDQGVQRVWPANDPERQCILIVED